jgi:hypothetical protein
MKPVKQSYVRAGYRGFHSGNGSVAGGIGCCRLGDKLRPLCVSQNGSNAVFSTVTRLSSAESQGLRNCLMTKIAQIFVIRQAGMLAISGGVQAFCMREGCVAAAAL